MVQVFSGYFPLGRALVLGLILLAVPLAGGSGLARAPAPKQATAKQQATAKPRKVRQQSPYQTGRAAWYGDRFHGRVTASGEQFDMFRMTAAHRKLPLGSYVRVTHLRTGRSVVVRVTDRGPKPPDRVIDLSYAAARRLGVVRPGLAAVRLDVMKNEETAQLTFSANGDVNNER